MTGLDGPAPPAGEPAAPSAALSVDHVDVTYTVRGHARGVLRDVSFHVARGESYGLVGESGCGKSTMALAIVRYLARNGAVTRGAIEIDGRDVLALKGAKLRELRAHTVAMVYQEPGRALNPSIRVGRQVAERFEISGVPRTQAVERSLEMLKKVRIADPESVMSRYPHQLSGGMLQRVVIAIALAAEPSLLILDEPTTALDATVEAEVLDLINALRDEFGTSLLFISHNLGVIAKMCERVGVLYAGELVEEGSARTVFDDPRHPYTVGLLRCIPRMDTLKAHRTLDTIPGFLPAPGATTSGCIYADRCGLVQERCRTEAPPLYSAGPAHGSRCHFHERAQALPRATQPEPEVDPLTTETEAEQVLISAAGVSKTFRIAGQEIRGLVDVSIDLHAGETLGLVGESGSGKTTLARVLLGLTAPDPGAAIELDGDRAPGSHRSAARDEQKAIQIVFQNPDSALNRRHSVRRLISRSLSRLGGYHGQALLERLSTLIVIGPARPSVIWRCDPAQLSGGLKQRVAIARAFAGGPGVVVCDEPTSALDVSVQAAILNLLSDLQRRERVSYLFISHDLGVVRYLSDRIAVLYLGRLMEVGPAERVFSDPITPTPRRCCPRFRPSTETERERIKLSGEIPSAADPPMAARSTPAVRAHRQHLR